MWEINHEKKDKKQVQKTGVFVDYFVDYFVENDRLFCRKSGIILSIILSKIID